MAATMSLTDSGKGAPCGRSWSKAAVQSLVILAAAAAIGLAFNQLRPTGLPLVQDWSAAGRLQAEKPGENLAVSLEDAKALFYARDAVFVDARPEEFFEMGHIQGALSLPWEDFESRFEAAMVNVPRDALVIVYCDGESCSLSRDLALALLGKGYSHVQALLNGWTLWQEAQMPTAEGPPQ